MVKLMKFLGYLFFFVGALVFFIPKISLYHYAEKELKKHKVIFSKEEAVDNGTFLSLHHLKVSYDSIESAEVKLANVNIFVLYNSLSVEGIVLSEISSSFIPSKIEKLDISYSILDPLHLNANANGEFGKVSAKLHIFDRNVSVNLVPSKLMQRKYNKTLQNLEKNSDGSYKYAKAL